MSSDIGSELEATAAARGSALRNAPPLWRLVSRNVSPISMLSNGDKCRPFYCVHSIGGDVNKFHDLARCLGPEQLFYGIQVPKDKMTADFAVSIGAIANYYVEILLLFQPEGPIFLGGWSIGAIIALEMAQQLRAIGRHVPLLVALDGAPCNTGGGISPWHPRYSWKLLRNIPRWIKDDERPNWSFSAFARRIAVRVAFRTLVNIPSLGRYQTLHSAAAENVANNVGLLSDQRAFIRALYAASHNYIPKPYAGHVVVYQAKIQPLWHLLQVGAAWTIIAKQTEIVEVDGGHISLFREPAIAFLAAHLRKRLATLRVATEVEKSIEGDSSKGSDESTQSCGVQYAANATASLPLARRKPG